MLSKVDSSLNFVHCENGKIGLGKLNEHIANNTDNIVILLALSMPILNGWGFLDEIQSAQFNDYQNITLYILSSSIYKVDIERARQYLIVKKIYNVPKAVWWFIKH